MLQRRIPPIYASRRRRLILGGLSVGVVLIIAAIAVLLSMFTDRTAAIFESLIDDSVRTAHSSQEVESTRVIDEVENLMGAVASVYETDSASGVAGTSERDRAYLEAIRQLDSIYEVTMLTTGDLAAALADVGCQDFDAQRELAKLGQGTTVVTTVFLLDEDALAESTDQPVDAMNTGEEGQRHVFAVLTPVIHEGNVTNVLCALVRAELLVESVPVENYGDVYMHNYLVEPDGDILLSSNNGTATNLLERLAEDGGTEEQIARMRESLLVEQDELIKMEGLVSGTLYFAVGGVDCNGWELVSVYNSSQINSYLVAVVRNMETVLRIMMAFVLVLLFGFWRLYERVRKSETEKAARYDLLAEFSDTVLFEYDFQSRAMSITPNVMQRFPLDHPDDIRPFDGSYRYNIVHPDDIKTLRETLDNAEQLKGRDTVTGLFRLLDRNGTYHWMECEGKVLRSKTGKPLSLIGKMSDHSQHKAKEDQLIDQASRDALTGALNKTATPERIDRLLSSGVQGALFMLDIDDFKLVNDNLGHSAGDQALVDFVADMCSVFRHDDVIGRVGGDEFVVFVPGIEDRTAAQEKIADLRDRMALRKDKAISVSTGIAVSPQDGLTYAELFDAADGAMYREKYTGKGSGTETPED